jgi:AraC family transcriptional regulator, exoenzyme S synthesis regulatory protein ExsA
MQVQNIPGIYLSSKDKCNNFFVYDFKMNEDTLNNKVDLTQHMFSFLQTGEKKVHCEDSVIEVNKNQSVLIKSGNCIMTELLSNDAIYFCKLFFFSNDHIIDFLEKYNFLFDKVKKDIASKPFFAIENDAFINAFATSISSILKLKSEARTMLLSIKFEEIMLYLSQKYGSTFISYIQSLAIPDQHSPLKKIVEANIYTNLSITDIAFLSNMSLSTFKRHFEQIYKANPGKWLQQKRLARAKQILEKGLKKPSDIYTDYGYNNLSNFSIAFKQAFDMSPKQCYLNAKK